jgi:DNA polymerase III epsilon subunit-like protein
MQLIGLDFETTGLNPEKDLIIEVGAVVWDTDLHAPIVIDNFLTNWGVAITPEVTKVNGISDNMVVTYGISPETAFHRLKEILNRSDYVVAHNGNLFDKVFLEKWFLEAETDSFQPQHTWIDTIHDIE